MRGIRLTRTRSVTAQHLETAKADSVTARSSCFEKSAADPTGRHKAPHGRSEFANFARRSGRARRPLDCRRKYLLPRPRGLESPTIFNSNRRHPHRFPFQSAEQNQTIGLPRRALGSLLPASTPLAASVFSLCAFLFPRRARISNHARSNRFARLYSVGDGPRAQQRRAFHRRASPRAYACLATLAVSRAPSRVRGAHGGDQSAPL